MIRWSSAFLATLIAFAPLHGDNEITKDEMIGFMDSVKCLFEGRYAPNQWKQGYCQWDCSREMEKVKSEIHQSQDLTVKGFQRSLRKFFNSTKDYHVNVAYHSTEWAMLPFRVKGIGNRYYITYVDDDKLGDGFNIEVGDELVNFGGENPHDVILGLIESSTPSATDETDRSIAEVKLTLRSGWSGDVVPRDPLTVTFQSKETGSLNTYQLIWDYHPEAVPDCQIVEKATNQLPKLFDAEKMKMDRAFPLATNIKKCQMKMTQDPNEFGERVSFLPRLGEVIWSTPESNPFDAYLYYDEDHRVMGYLRIPHYMFDEDEVAQFAEVIEVLQENADALVLDQLNNTGGNLFIAYGFASMLTDKPLVTPKEHMLLSQYELMDAFMILDALDWVQSAEDAKNLFGETFFGNPVTYQMILFIREYCRFLQDQWIQGKYYTDLTHIFGIDHVNPHPKVRFTKPIVMLINGLDFSCGDFFPAIMQDNKRVTLLGTRTAGAGGFVVGHQIANRLGIYYMTITGSLGIRLNGQPIENLGVQPDIVNELTVEDISGNYQNYVKKIHETLKEVSK